MYPRSHSQYNVLIFCPYSSKNSVSRCLASKGGGVVMTGMVTRTRDQDPYLYKRTCCITRVSQHLNFR